MFTWTSLQGAWDNPGRIQEWELDMELTSERQTVVDIEGCTVSCTAIKQIDALDLKKEIRNEEHEKHG